MSHIVMARIVMAEKCAQGMSHIVMAHIVMAEKCARGMSQGIVGVLPARQLELPTPCRSGMDVQTQKKSSIGTAVAHVARSARYASSVIDRS